MRRGISFLGVVFAVGVACGGTTVTGDGGVSDGGGDGSLPADVTACTTGDDCVVIPSSCCGSCGAATPTDMVAVRKDKVSAARAARCTGVGCPACFMEQSANLQARCVSGKCQAFDVRADAVSACSGPNDCKLRMAECCECGGTHVIAIASSKEAAYTSAVCPASPSCAKCAPTYPMFTVAVCDAKTSHCSVEMINGIPDAGTD